jgi:hypothetical protein
MGKLPQWSEYARECRVHVSLSFMKKAYLNRAKVQGEKRGWRDIFYDIGGLSFYKIFSL